MIDSVCVVITRAGGEEMAALGIRTAWATLSSAMETKIVFMEDGVFNLLPGRGYVSSMIRDFIGEEGEIYCTREALEKRGLSERDLVGNIRVIGISDVAGVVDLCQSMAVF